MCICLQIISIKKMDQENESAKKSVSKLSSEFSIDSSKEFKAKSIDKRIVISRTKQQCKFDTPLLHSKIKKFLPNNYNFEILKILNRIDQLKAKRVSLQFPEGLFLFSTTIADLITEFAQCEVIIIGDVTYGACCIDDYVASINQCQLIVHFAHSCLIPINEMIDNIKVLYIFVDIKFDIWHCIETFKKNFPLEQNLGRFSIASSIQFVSSIHTIAKELRNLNYDIDLPQAKPLSAGEVLGCTSPSESIDNVFFVCDGRFHLEAMMIANPFIKNFYKYNPYDKQLTVEEYNYKLMIKNREEAIRKSIKLLETHHQENSIKKKVTVGLILGTLGHQGSVKVLKNLRNKLLSKRLECSFINVCIPEINAKILNLFDDTIDIWLQISCPRLSIDWALDVIRKPLLTPFMWYFMWYWSKISKGYTHIQWISTPQTAQAIGLQITNAIQIVVVD